MPIDSSTSYHTQLLQPIKCRRTPSVKCRKTPSVRVDHHLMVLVGAGSCCIDFSLSIADESILVCTHFFRGCSLSVRSRHDFLMFSCNFMPYFFDYPLQVLFWDFFGAKKMESPVSLELLPNHRVFQVYSKAQLKYPIWSMYGIFTYIYHKIQPNVDRYTLRVSCGYDQIGT